MSDLYIVGGRMIYRCFNMVDDNKLKVLYRTYVLEFWAEEGMYLKTNIVTILVLYKLFVLFYEKWCMIKTIKRLGRTHFLYFRFITYWTTKTFHELRNNNNNNDYGYLFLL